MAATSTTATKNIAGSTPTPFLRTIGDTLVNGIGTFIDSEIAERAASSLDTADVRDAEEGAETARTMTSGGPSIKMIATGVGLGVVFIFGAAVIWRITA